MIHTSMQVAAVGNASEMAKMEAELEVSGQCRNNSFISNKPRRHCRCLSCVGSRESSW
jgi:hypothetical protein